MSESFIERLPDDSGVRSFVIVREGDVAFEYFRDDVTPGALENVNSVTKSVVALATGIALSEGALQTLDAPLSEFVPEARDASLDPRVSDISLRHLLTMTSGFEWDPGVIDECVLGACERFDVGDRVRFILGRPFAHAPGERFAYDSHAVHLLSLALQRATGRTLERYTREKLFAPLGIERYEWIADEDGHTFAARGLMLATHDMTKLGSLMLARGVWQDARIVDASFIDNALTAHGEGGPPVHDARYGYLWWIATGYVFASGFGGQFVFVDRERGIVAAATSDGDDAARHAREFFERYREERRGG